MNIKTLICFALGLASSAALSVESSYTIYQQNGFKAEATVNDCASGCSRQLAVMARYDFLYDGDYDDLLAMLQAFGLRVSIYDGQWSDADEGEVVMKVSSTIHQRQRWRRANLRRKMDTPIQMASAIHATVPAGTMVTLEFHQTPLPLVGSDFTINVRRYANDSLVSSGSRAVAPISDGNIYNDEP